MFHALQLLQVIGDSRVNVTLVDGSEPSSVASITAPAFVRIGRAIKVRGAVFVLVLFSDSLSSSLGNISVGQHRGTGGYGGRNRLTALRSYRG